jgi:hypothetical protein
MPARDRHRGAARKDEGHGRNGEQADNALAHGMLLTGGRLPLRLTLEPQHEDR